MHTPGISGHLHWRECGPINWVGHRCITLEIPRRKVKAAMKYCIFALTARKYSQGIRDSVSAKDNKKAQIQGFRH